MKKYILKITVLILIILVQVACNSGSNPAGTKIYFREELLYSDDNYKMLPGNKLFMEDKFIINSENRILTREPDLTNPVTIINNPNPLFIFDVDENNKIYILNVNLDENNRIVNTGREILMYDANGEFVGNIKLEDSRTLSNTDVNRIIVKRDIIYLLYTRGIQILNNSGKTVSEYTCENMINGADIDAEGNIILITATMSSPITEYREMISKNTGKIIWSNVSESAALFQRNICYNPCGNNIYITNDYGIKIYNMDGTYKNDLIQFKDYEIISRIFDGYIIRNTLLLPGQSFYIEITKGKSYIIYKYEYSEEKQTNIRNVNINLYAYDLSKQDIDMIYKYEVLNPGIKFNINMPAIDKNDSFRAKEEYIQKINLMMMSGGLWDIVATTEQAVSLPYKKYINENMLADFNELDNENVLTNPDMYFQNIFDAFRENEKMYILPVNIGFTAITVNKALLDKYNINVDVNNWDWSGFTEIAEELSFKTDARMFDSNETPPDGAPFYVNAYNITFSNVQNSIVDYVNKSFNITGLSDLLHMISKLNNAKYFNKNSEIPFINRLHIISLYAPYYSSTYSKNSNVSVPSLVELIMKSKENDLIPVLVPKYKSVTGRSFVPYMSFAICKGSNHKEEAYFFLKYLMQYSNRITPAKLLFTKNIEERDENDENVNDLPAALVDMVKSCMENLVVAQYSEMDYFMREDVYKLYNNLTTVEELMDTIKNKVWLYLNE